jgi:hypothetical protein
MRRGGIEMTGTGVSLLSELGRERDFMIGI